MATSAVGPHTKHGRHNPCPKCGKDNCITFADGGTLCLRTESPRRTPSGIGWYHPGAGDDWRDGLYPPAPPPERPPEPAPPDPVIRDRGLRFLIDACPLSPDHRDELRRRGLLDAHVDASPFGTLPDDGPARDALAAALVDELGPEAFGNVPGLHADEDGAPRINAHAGLMVGIEQDGRLVGITIRPDDPTVRASGKYRHLSSPPARYPGGAASGAPTGVIFPVGWVEGTPVEEPMAVEGILKGYVVANRLGRPVVAMPGATITGDVERLVARLGAASVVLAFDNDRATNPAVARSEAALADELLAAGYRVRRATWSAMHKGLDDALAAGVIPVLEPWCAGDAKACGDRVRDLERKVAELTWDLTETRRTLSTVIQTATNTRNLGDTGGAVAVLIGADLATQATDRPTADGYYRVLPARIANGWKDDTGEEPDRPAIIGQSTIRRYVKRFAEAGLLDVDYRPATIVRTVFDRRLGREVQKDIPIEEPWVRFKGSLSDTLAPAAAYHNAERPDRGGDRKSEAFQARRVFPTACPGCGGTVEAACRDCGLIVPSVDINVAAESLGLLDSAVEFCDGPAPESRVQLERPSNATEKEYGGDESCDQVERTTEEMPDPAPMAAVRVALAVADHTSDRDRARRARADLMARLAPFARERGVEQVPKPSPAPAPLPAFDQLAPPEPHPCEQPEVDRWTW